MSPRRAKSEWEFGELFPKTDSRPPLSVSQLTAKIRDTLRAQFELIRVAGEISNLRAQSSGHIYFTLKDAGAQLNCVVFRGERQVDRSCLRDGKLVVLAGEITVYEPRGQYQLRVSGAELQGQGALQGAFEALKRRLEAEGLFDQARKRALPRFPSNVGLVTSPTGAAIQDFLHVAGRRDPGLKLVLAACRVQGTAAAGEIAAAIELLNEWSEASRLAGGSGLDLIVITRGGGSLEDLWPFNEESVARAIGGSKLPVISAVGHEIDFTIGDFVADVRAATPSAAAELVTEGVYSSVEFVASIPGRMRQLTHRRLGVLAGEIKAVRRHLALLHPRRQVEERSQRLDDCLGVMKRVMRAEMDQRQTELRSMRARWLALRPMVRIARSAAQVMEQQRQLTGRCRFQMGQLRNRWERAAARLQLLSPDNVLRRGYSMTFDAVTGRPLRAAAGIKPGSCLMTQLIDGEIRSVVASSTTTVPPPRH